MNSMLDHLSYCGNADKRSYGICTVVLKGTYFQKCMLNYSRIELQNFLNYAFLTIQEVEEMKLVLRSISLPANHCQG